MTSLFHAHQTNSWKTVSSGVEFCVLRDHGDGGSTVLVRMAAGAHAPLHDHPGGEETYLISGRLRVGEVHLGPGDYLWTPAGEAHEGYAEGETMFFVVLPKCLRLAAHWDAAPERSA